MQELTVSASLDEIIQCGEDWKARLDKLLTGPSPVRHFFIHSWSLIRRDSKGFHDSFNDEYSARFRWILDYLNDRCGIVGMETTASLETTHWKVAPESIADSTDGRPKANFEMLTSGFLRKRLFATNKAKSAIETRYQEVANDELPMRSQPGENNKYFAVEVLDSVGVTRLPYELSGKRSHLQMNGQLFCGNATEVFESVFQKHPEIDEIVFSNVFGEHLLKSPHVIASPVGVANVLSLPEDFDRYRNLVIDKDLGDVIERKERELFHNYEKVRFGFCGHASDDEMTPAIFEELVDLVRHAMREKAEMTSTPWLEPFAKEWLIENYPVYRDAGLCSYLEVEGKKVAAMLNIVENATMEHISAGHIESAVPGGRIRDLLFFKTIEKFISLNGRLVKFNEPDSGGKGRFGVTEKQIYCGTAHRRKSGVVPSDAEILELLGKGCNVRDIHIYLGVSAKKWIERTPSTAYRFDFTVDRLGPPPRGWRGWHAPIIDALHITFDQLYRVNRPKALFDWNCGAGRNLIALAEYGLDQLGGLVFGTAALEASRANFTAANMALPDLLCVSSPEAIPSLDLRGYDLFLAYHPCSETVFVNLVERMKAASAASGNRVHLVYINCVYQQTLIQAGFTQIEAFEQHHNGWRFSDRAGIFSYNAATAGKIHR